MKILIIEDDWESACVLEHLLGSQNELRITGSAEEAVRLGTTWKPHLIIADWKLNEDLDGVDICRKIIAEHKATIVFVTGSSVEDLRMAATALEPLHVLRKPLDHDEFSSLIARIRDECAEAVQ